MAKIVLGLGTSHTPMLLASDEMLPRFLETDQNIRHRDKEGRPATYAELLEKADPRMAAMVTPAELVARQNRARAAATQLSKTLAAAKLDALHCAWGRSGRGLFRCSAVFGWRSGPRNKTPDRAHEPGNGVAAVSGAPPTWLGRTGACRGRALVFGGQKERCGWRSMQANRRTMQKASMPCSMEPIRRCAM
jgi:hypothetical protein